MTADSLKHAIFQQLSTVMDPELSVDIVSLGLIYDVKVSESNGRQQVEIVMTLTTPGCPLAGVFDQLLRSAILPTDTFDPEEDLTITLTFDPPWVADMMTQEARMELGFE